MKNKENGKVIFYIAHIELPDINALAHRVLANCIALREAGYKPVLIGYSKDKSTSKNIRDTHFKVNGFDCYNFSGGYRFYASVIHEKQMSECTYPCGMEK